MQHCCYDLVWEGNLALDSCHRIGPRAERNAGLEASDASEAISVVSQLRPGPRGPARRAHIEARVRDSQRLQVV